MSVVGFDIGASTSFVALARQGGIETVANEFSQRATPTYVSFGEQQRVLGTSAQQKVIMNLKNTCWLFKHLIGRPFEDNIVERYQKIVPYKLVKIPETGRCGVEVSHCGETQVFSAEQILAMFLGKVKDIGESNMDGRAVSDCVITCPFYLTNAERAAWLEAAKIANLNCLRLMNETTAVALAYGIFKTDLPETKDEPRRVAFIDIGFSQTQVSVAAFNKGQLKMIAVTGDRNLGGYDFDRILVDHFAEEFKGKYKIDVKSNKRAELRLTQGCEKLKKQMSANATPMTLHVECIMDDKDVMGKMARSEFEELLQKEGILDRFRGLLIDCRDQLKDQKIDSVEMVGGSSRCPFVREIINEVFGQAPKTTLNADEAVSRGAALQCAILSPSFRVREFSISDVQKYPIRIDWQGSDGKPGNALLFDVNEAVPMSKVLTFTRKDIKPFEIKASYHRDDFSFFPEKTIGTFKSLNIKEPTEIENEPPTPVKIKVKLRVDNNGQLIVPQAVQIDRQQVEVKEEVKAEPPKDEKKAEKKDDKKEEKAASEEKKEEKMETDEKTIDATPQLKVTKQVKAVKLELKVEQDINGALNEAVLTNYIQKEFELLNIDRKERERQDAKNDVEEYVYGSREKMSTQYGEFATTAEKENIDGLLQKTEDWLYEEGYDEKKQVYLEKLDELKAVTSPIIKRHTEFETRKPALDRLGAQILKVEKFLQKYENKDETVSHIASEKYDQVKKSLESQREWYNKTLSAVAQLKKTDEPCVLTCQVDDSTRKLKHDCDSIMDTPKPKPPPSPKKEEETKDKEGEKKSDEMTDCDKTEEKNGDDGKEQPPPMDLD